MAVHIEEMMDISASPRSLRAEEDNSSDSDHATDTEMLHHDTEQDLARLEHVYHALMGSLLPPLTTSQQQQPEQRINGTAAESVNVTSTRVIQHVTTSPNADVEPATDMDVEVGAGAGAGGGAKNAKRRKMDKKKAKREEQKLAAAEEVVDIVNFRLFSRQPVRPISLLPAAEPSWTVPNPRHIPLSEEELRRLREKIGGVVVDASDIGTTVAAAAAVGLPVTRAAGHLPVQSVYVAAGQDKNVREGMQIIHLAVQRERLPPFSAAFFARYPGYTVPPASTFSKPATTANQQHRKKNPTQPSSSKPSTSPAAAATAANITAVDPVKEALKRSTMQKRARAAVHVVFTAHGKPLPFHTPAAAQALARAAPAHRTTTTTTTTTTPTTTTSTTRQQVHVPRKVPVLDACLRTGPGAVEAVNVKENKERKAHLRRVARRVSRLHASLSSAGTSTATTNATHRGPWIRPSSSPAASFYAPPEDVGGKSAGYGYGFAASRPGVREREAGRRKGGMYVRDRMR